MSKTIKSVKIAEKGAIAVDLSGSVDANGMTPEYWARLEAMTEAEIMAAALSDPNAQPSTPEQLARMKPVSPAKFIRQQLAYSQSAFAETFRIPLGTLRDWEQHRREPDQAAQAYLDVIAHEPEAVIRALAAARLPAGKSQANMPRAAAE